MAASERRTVTIDWAANQLEIDPEQKASCWSFSTRMPSLWSLPQYAEPRLTISSTRISDSPKTADWPSTHRSQ